MMLENNNIRLSEEQCKSLVDNNPKIIEYVLDLFTTIFRNPGMHWDLLEKKKWLNSKETAWYIGKKESYLNHLCTHNLIEYNKFKGQREFDIDVLREYRVKNTVTIKALSDDKIEEFNRHWSEKQKERKVKKV